MQKRIISSIVLIAIAVLALFLGEKATIGLIVVGGIIALYEYLNVVIKKAPFHEKLSIIAIGQILIFTAIFETELLLAVIPVVFILIFMVNILNKRYEASNSIYEMFGIIYISLFLSLLITLVKLPSGMNIVYMILVVCYSTDTFAFLFGVKFGKHKLCPGISPKKSIEGSVAGTVLATLAGTIMGIFYIRYGIINLPIHHFILLSLVVSIFSQFGDLVASMVKRRYSVKDYSNLIPGHGGVLDRIDSLLFAICGMYFYISIIINIL